MNFPIHLNIASGVGRGVMVALAVLVLSGCTSTSASVSDKGSPATNPPSSQTSPTGSAPDAGGTALIPPTLESLGAEESNSLAQNALKAEWDGVIAQYPKATKPVVKRVRFVALSDRDQVQAACLTDHGFPSSVGETGGVSSAAADGQGEALEVARYVCDATFPVDPKYSVPLNHSQLSYLYAYFTGPLTKCLEAHGITPTDAPSYGKFEADYPSGTAWTPYQAVLESGDFVAMSKSCPEIPDGLYG